MSTLDFKRAQRFCDNFWSAEGEKGFDALIGKLDNGLEATRILIQYLLARSHAEEEFAKMIQKSNREYTTKYDTGSMKTVCEKIASSTEAVMRMHNQFSIKIREEIDAVFTEFRDSQRKLRKMAEAEREGFKRSMDRENNIVNKAIAEYSRRCKEMVVANERAKSGSSKNLLHNSEKMNDKALKARLDMEKAELDCKGEINRLNELQDTYDAKFVDLANNIQKNEETRLVLTKRFLSKITSLQLELFGTMGTGLFEQMSKVVDSVDEVDDINEFIQYHRTGSEPPLRSIFQSYFSPESQNGSCIMKKVSIKQLMASRSSSMLPAAPMSMGSMDHIASSSTHDLTMNQGQSMFSGVNSEEESEKDAMKKQLQDLQELVRLQSAKLHQLEGTGDNPQASAQPSTAMKGQMSRNPTLRTSKKPQDGGISSNAKSNLDALLGELTNEIDFESDNDEDNRKPHEVPARNQQSTTSVSTTMTSSTIQGPPMQSRSYTAHKVKLNHIKSQSVVRSKSNSTDDLEPKITPSISNNDRQPLSHMVGGSTDDSERYDIPKIRLAEANNNNDNDNSQSLTIAFREPTDSNYVNSTRTSVNTPGGFVSSTVAGSEADEDEFQALINSSKPDIKNRKFSGFSAQQRQQQQQQTNQDNIPPPIFNPNNTSATSNNHVTLDSAIVASPQTPQHIVNNQQQQQSKVHTKQERQSQSSQQTNNNNENNDVTSSSSVEIPILEKRVYSRKSIKMEGWLDVAETANGGHGITGGSSTSTGGGWIKQWCTLEGGYLWFFDGEEDPELLDGQRAPSGMVNVTRCVMVEIGCGVDDVEPISDHLFTISVELNNNISKNVFAAPNEVEMWYWIEAIHTIKKR